MKEMCTMPSEDKHRLRMALSSQIPLLQSVEGLSEARTTSRKTSFNMDTDEILNQSLHYHDFNSFSVKKKNCDAKMIIPTNG